MEPPGCPSSHLFSNSNKHASNEKLVETRQQLNDVMDVMRSNLEKMAVRSDRLENLASRAEVLDMSASEFHKSAKEAHSKEYWRAHFYKYVLSSLFLLCAISGIYVLFT